MPTFDFCQQAEKGFYRIQNLANVIGVDSLWVLPIAVFAVKL